MKKGQLRDNKGDKKMKDTHQTSKRVFTYAKRPYEVEIAAAQLDLMLIDSESRKPLGRPWIRIAVDPFTRRILVSDCSFDPTASHTALTRPLSGIGKSYYEPTAPINNWRLRGVPQRVDVQNGNPQDKANLERAHRRLEVIIRQLASRKKKGSN